MNRCWFVRSGDSTPLRSAKSEVKCSLTVAHSFSTAELLNFSPLRSAILSICWFLLCFFLIRCIYCLSVCLFFFCFIVLLPIVWCNKLYIYISQNGPRQLHSSGFALHQSCCSTRSRAVTQHPKQLCIYLNRWRVRLEDDSL